MRTLRQRDCRLLYPSRPPAPKRGISRRLSGSKREPWNCCQPSPVRHGPAIWRPDWHYSSRTGPMSHLCAGLFPQRIW
jgi:hypothetical protein